MKVLGARAEREEVGGCQRFGLAGVVVARLWELDSEVVRLWWSVSHLKTWLPLIDSDKEEVRKELLSW